MTPAAREGGGFLSIGRVGAGLGFAMCASDVKQMIKNRARAAGARADGSTWYLTAGARRPEAKVLYDLPNLAPTASVRPPTSGSQWIARTPPVADVAAFGAAAGGGVGGDARPGAARARVRRRRRRRAPEAAAVGGRGGRAPGAARRGARGEGVGEDRAVPAHAQRQAVPRAVPQPPAPRALQGRVVGRGGHRDLEPRARGGHEVGGDLRAVHADADGQRHQEPVELDHPQVARAGRPRMDRGGDRPAQPVPRQGRPPAALRDGSADEGGACRGGGGRGAAACEPEARGAEGAEGHVALRAPQALQVAGLRRRGARFSTPARPAPEPASFAPTADPPSPSPRRRSSRN